MRISAYALTAAWLCAIFNIIPLLGILGLYSLYLLHSGLAALMRLAADRTLIYTLVVVVCIMVIWFVIVGILAAIFGFGMTVQCMTLLRVILSENRFAFFGIMR
jgi:hypothetical protein